MDDQFFNKVKGAALATWASMKNDILNREAVSKNVRGQGLAAFTIPQEKLVGHLLKMDWTPFSPDFSTIASFKEMQDSQKIKILDRIFTEKEYGF